MSNQYSDMNEEIGVMMTKMYSLKLQQFIDIFFPANNGMKSAILGSAFTRYGIRVLGKEQFKKTVVELITEIDNFPDEETCDECKAKEATDGVP